MERLHNTASRQLVQLFNSFANQVTYQSLQYEKNCFMFLNRRKLEDCLIDNGEVVAGRSPPHQHIAAQVHTLHIFNKETGNSIIRGHRTGTTGTA